MTKRKGDTRNGFPELNDDFHKRPVGLDKDDLEKDPSIEQNTDHQEKMPLPSASTVAKAVAIDTLSNESNILESPVVRQVISIIAGYGLIVGAFKSFKAFRKSFRELRQEFKNKKPAKTYQARVMEKVWKCVKDIASFTGYVASILSLIAAVANPFGLAIAGSTLTIITAVGLGAAFVSVLAEKVSSPNLRVNLLRRVVTRY